MWKMLAIGLMAACSSACTYGVGNGKKVTETRAISGFSRVENRTCLDVVVREAPTASVSVTSDSNLQPYIVTSVSNEILIIETPEAIACQEGAHVEAALPRFLGAIHGGTGSFVVEGVTRTEDLELTNGGTGALRYCGPARNLTATLSGTGDLFVCIPSTHTTERVYLTAQGTGQLEYEGSANQVDALNSGGGPLTVRGTAASLKARLKGLGRLDARELGATNALLTMEGAGNLRATVSGQVDISISGSGNIDLWGEAHLGQMHRMGSGQLLRH